MKITLQDEFLLKKVALVREVVLPYQWEILNDRVPDAPVSHCIKNFQLAAGESTESHFGVVFLDSDLYKWLEGVSYSLMHVKDEALLKNAEYAIALIGRAQMPDGYINTWYQTKEKGKRWTDLAWGHELYCAGHLFEAAVAHHQATGQDSLLSIACRFADHICQTFAKSAKYPGHPEVELGLIKLYQETGRERYLEQAQCFMDARGKDAGALMIAKQEKPIFDDTSTFGPDYFQAHKPVREQRDADGHAAMAYQLQATAFETVANVYAPFYRQCDASAVLGLQFEKRDALLEQAPLQDALAAFDYYIQHYNNGRPFVLAGHSQGSDVLRLLLAEYMPAHPEVYERMIAAYCIGTSITNEFLAEHPLLRFAENADDTQVIISYNTEAPGVTEANPLVSKDALVINPISWTRSEEPAGTERNLGSALLDATGALLIIPGFADAKVDLNRSVVGCSTVEGKLPVLASSAHLPKGVYHSFDYSLYYANLTENISQRIAAYFSKQNR